MITSQEITDKLRAPIAANTVDGKVEVVEKRLNAKVLPFLGMHGMLLALIYLINETELISNENYVKAIWTGIVLAMVSLASGVLAGLCILRGWRGQAGGSIAVSVILAMVTSLLLTASNVGIILAWIIFLIALVLNKRDVINDYEINTVFIYLPVIFFFVRELSIPAQIMSAIAMFGPAIFVKFRLQPKSSKLPLGFSILVFLSMVVGNSGDTEVLVSFLVLLALILFIYYNFRNRHLVGSSFRYFLFDAIAIGLWGTLVVTFDMPGDWPLVLWGVGVVIYQTITLSQLQRSSLKELSNLAARDARLAWIQIGTLAIFYDVLSDIMYKIWRIQHEYLAIMVIAMFFIPVYLRFKSRFLALATRLWIGGSLLVAADETSSTFQRFYVDALNKDGFFSKNNVTAESLREMFTAGYQPELILVLVAFLVGLAASLRVPPVGSISWWHGLIRPRHAVLIRRTGRMIVANANRIAFVGGFIGAVAAIFKWMNYAGGNKQGVGSRDMILLGVFVFAVAMTILFGRYYFSCCDLESHPILEASLLDFIENDLVYVISWNFWGIVLYLYGVVLKDYLARFFSIAFVFMPLVMYASNHSMDGLSFSKVILATCFSLFCFGLFRWKLFSASKKTSYQGRFLPVKRK